MIRRLTRRQTVLDLLVPAVILAVFLAPAIGTSAIEAFALVGFCLALSVRRMATLAALGIAWLTAVAEMIAGVSPPGPSNVLIVGVLYACGAHGTRLVRWLGFASAILGAACIAGYLNLLPLVSATNSPGIGVAFAAAFTFSAALAGFLLSWTTGFLVRSILTTRQTRAVARRAELEVVQEQERTRIARDMHDVVAHSLAVVIAQADGARYLRATRPEAVDEALQTISGTAREALADVRVLLAQLRYDQGAAPQPALVDLDRLYEQFRAAGLELRLDGSGEAHPLTTSAQLAVYRIVQESLTNALRHAAVGRPVVVRFDWAPGGLHLSIASELPDAPVAPSGGHGIAGMTERAALGGGHLDTVSEDGRFLVRAWLPVTATAPVALPRSGQPA